MFVKSIFLITALVLSPMAFASGYSTQALQLVVTQAKVLRQEGKQAVVMFDLDDTLINTRDRSVRIMHDFAAQQNILAGFPDDARLIAALTDSQVHYLVKDTLIGIGVTNSTLLQQANDFWLAHFFSNQYSATDIPIPGAADYLNQLDQAGAKIIYLTGRDVVRMQLGTEANLRSNGFPIDPAQSLLIMKLDPQQDDLKFKESQFSQIAAMGTVIAVFENEPANINSMADAFPGATAIFLDTIHSPKPDVPEARVQWVPNFILQ